VQIWRPKQEVIRAQGKSVVFTGRRKHTEMTFDTKDVLLHACAFTRGW
jgi:hypothetical protein